MNKVSLQLIIKSVVNSGYYTESCVIRLGIFMSHYTTWWSVKCTQFKKSNFYGTTEKKTWRASNYRTGVGWGGNYHVFVDEVIIETSALQMFAVKLTSLAEI